jgi:DNA-binding MarR family transcriptional regulator
MVSLVTDRQAEFRSAAAELDLHELEAGSIVAIPADAMVPMSMLASRLGLTRSHATRVVDALEGRGLAERHFDHRDRRVRLVALTADGREARRILSEAGLEPPASLHSLSESEAAQLVALLSHLGADAEVAGRPAP